MKLKREVKLKPLDYLLVPTGWPHQRKKRALEEIKRRKIKNIYLLNGKDSEEDILYLGKILKGKERIGFVTFPLHYIEYTEIIKKAQKDRNFPRGIKTENVATEQTFKQFIYGILGLIEERLDKKVNYVHEEHRNKMLQEIRGAVIHFLKH